MTVGQKSPVLRFLHRVIRSERLGELSDADLLDRFVSDRDEGAFELLVWRHQRMVLSLCRRLLRDPEDAEDAFQSTFLVLVHNAKRIHKREALASWIYKVAYRCALRARAATQRHDCHKQGGADLATLLSHDEPVSAERNEEWLLLCEEVQRLPEKYRTPVILCYLEGKTFEEAARQLCCPRTTISTRLTKAREILHNRMVARGVILSAAAFAAMLCEEAARGGSPATLVNATAKAAFSYASGNLATSAVSAKVVALTQGVVRTMFVTKLKIATAFLLSATIIVGTALLAHQAISAQTPEIATPANVERIGPEADARPGEPKPEPKVQRFERLGPDADEGPRAPKSDPKAFKPLAVAEFLQSCSWTLKQVNLDESTISISDTASGPGLFRFDAVNGKRSDLRGGALEGLTVAKDAKVSLNGQAAKLADLRPFMILTIRMAERKSVVIEIHAISLPAEAEYIVEKLDLKKNIIVLRLGQSDRTMELPLAKEAKVIIEMHNVPGVPNPQILGGKISDIVSGTPVSLQMGLEGDRLVVRSVKYRK
jgi:RNA polymerase sigma factor (sigma-70 family)